MAIFKRLFDFYIQSSIHVGIAVLSLVCITVFSNDLGKHIVYLICVFFGTVLGYNLLKYYDVILTKLFTVKNHLALFTVTILAGIGFLCCFLYLKQAIQISLIEVGFLVLVYPFLRKYGLFKIFLVSFCVAIITVYIPFLTTKFLTLDFYITFLQRFLIVISWLIPFEILDSKTDSFELNTIPQQYGIKKAKLFGILLVIPFIVLEFLKTNYSYSVMSIGIITVLFINFSSLKRNEYYTSFWVESIPIFWLGLLFLFS